MRITNMSTYQPNEQEKKVIAVAVAAGEQFKPVHKKLREIFTDEVVKQIDKLKAEVFGVTQGSAGRTVTVSTDPLLNFQWSEFCYWCFGVSAHRINQLLDTDEYNVQLQIERRAEQKRLREEQQAKYQQQLADAAAVIGADPTPVSDAEAVAILRTAWDKVVAAGGNDLNRVKMIDFCIKELENPITPLVGDEASDSDVIQNIEAAGINPHFDKKDPYAYFEQFREEPQTMGDEISAMLIEFKLDQQQIKEVLRYAEMNAKRTLNQMQTAVAA